MPNCTIVQLKNDRGQPDDTKALFISTRTQKGISRWAKAKLRYTSLGVVL